MRIYVASSWRNEHQPAVVARLRELGHEVYDFRHPPGGDHLGFSWADVDPAWQEWTPEAFGAGLGHPVALAGFESDFGAMRDADVCVLVLPSGRSAHLEAGWFAGAGKPVLVLYPPDVQVEPELMYRLAAYLVLDVDAVVLALDALSAPSPA